MRILCAMVAVATSAILPVMAGEDLATSAAFGGIHVDTSGSPSVIASSSDVGALWPITYRSGDTVTVTAPDGSVRMLAENAASDGSAAFAPNAGGLWRLDNSNGETALVGVAWSVFGGGWALNFGSPVVVGMHTKGEGPNRRGHANDFPSIAYSGDNWFGDASAASTVTFTPPEGSGLAPTTLNLTGSGVTSFTFDKAGRWTVTLTMADGTTCEAAITVPGGFVISFT